MQRGLDEVDTLGTVVPIEAVVPAAGSTEKEAAKVDSAVERCGNIGVGRVEVHAGEAIGEGTGIQRLQTRGAFEIREGRRG